MFSEADVARFKEKLDPPNERGCREWNANTDDAGYGRFHLGSAPVPAHRAAFLFAHGHWPEECRHTCDNPPCCEESHLLDGDHAANVRDSVERGRHVNVKKTHCPAGHPYDEINTYPKANGARGCRECHREQNRARRQRTAS